MNKLRHPLLIIVLGCCFGISLWAVPAHPRWITVMQPDSTTIEIKIIGDEWGHYYINRKGNKIKQNQDGWWVETTDTIPAAITKCRKGCCCKKK